LSGECGREREWEEAVLVPPKKEDEIYRDVN